MWAISTCDSTGDSTALASLGRCEETIDSVYIHIRYFNIYSFRKVMCFCLSLLSCATLLLKDVQQVIKIKAGLSPPGRPTLSTSDGLG